VGSKTSVAPLGEASYDEWTEFVKSSPDGSVYATPEYLDALCTATGGHFRIVVVRRGHEIVGGIPLYEERSAAGTFVSPRLLLYYNSPVLRRYGTRYPSERTARAVRDMGALAHWLNHTGYGRITLKCRSTITDVRPFMAAGWTAWPSYTYVAPLGELDVLWSRVEQNLRRLVARCEGLGVALSEDDDFDSFFRLHRDTMDRKDAHIYLPEVAFRRYFRDLHGQGLCTLYHVRRPGARSIASLLVLLGDDAVAHTVSAAADAEHLNSGATPFLRWKSFEALADRGYAGNDLTDAALNPVTHFKSQLGADLELCMVLESRRRLVYRAHTTMNRLYRKGRGWAGSVVRRGLQRGGP
jgi:hypothetical protein